MTMMKSYKNRNYEQALIETILKFDELLRNEKINEFLKNYSKSRAQNNKGKFSLELICKNKFNTYNENKNKNTYDENMNNFDNFEMEITNFNNEIQLICEKIQNENDFFSIALEENMKKNLIENDFDAIQSYFKSKIISNNENDKISKSSPFENKLIGGKYKKIILYSNY